jgi:sialic acid synthase SpsE
MYGSDQAASLESSNLKSFVLAVRAIPEVLGTGMKVITDAERAVRKKLRVDVVA